MEQKCTCTLCIHVQGLNLIGIYVYELFRNFCSNEVHVGISVVMRYMYMYIRICS